jgi:FlgD Ig-like domain/Cytochrome c7 and related cytochrome c
MRTAPRLASLAVLILVLLFAAANPAAASQSAPDISTQTLGPYIVIGWNDLGMHCANARFQDLTVLPPYNDIWAVVIRRGSPSMLPEVVVNPYTVTYRIQDNTYSVGKTDFWTYASQIFGTPVPDNVGLAGKGLSGILDPGADHFDAFGIPLTPYSDTDLVNPQPYQTAIIEAYDGVTKIAETTITVPISNEMMCSNCHHPDAGETVEHSILRLHDYENGTNLANSTPVLCARCHASNALGLPGTPGLPSLSEAMHDQHSEVTNNCYQCHPGPTTRCLRGTMATDFSLVCQNCHGSVLNVAETIKNGRQPWFQEPRCGDCHGPTYAEEPNTLYRNSKGHGNLYCPTCHNSPHAILPAREPIDNVQVIALQGHAGTLASCNVCHGYTPSGVGPHGLVVTGVADGGFGEGPGAQVMPAPNPFRSRTEIRYQVVDGSPILLAVFDASGRRVRVLTAAAQTPGRHTLVWDGRNDAGTATPAGVYFARITTGGTTATARMVKLDR